ncbi:hypothetical protein QR680_005426 [Steinernema hermaphroditum]|uniref:LNS2/PITP domain-containing protein n=1 Tax=Steinernema hermaphroditum TaxID=289476 RepID=A0AA39HS05_9BILA|nr:hypothetical protein QR680_005426 [Steinernema hermaphroditum]
MEYAYRLMRNVKYFYNTMNPATLSGAIDVIVVEQPDGTYLSTPFHCRFGKYGVFNSDEKYVDITINGVEIDLQMKLGENGIAFFVETTEEDDIPEYLVTSPLPDAPCPETDKVLAESAKVLKRQQRSETRARIESKRSQHNLSESSSISRSPSPVNRLLKPSKTDRNPSPRTERRSSLRKLKLPFSSSVFSSRRYRSLPDLSAVVQSTESGEHSPQSSKLKHSRSTVLKRSLSKPPSDRRQPKVTFSIVPDALSGSIPEKRPKRDNSLNESEDERSSTSSDQRQKESSSYEDRSRIADGALSDSEVDRQRNLPAGNDVSVWNWGQIPDSTTDTKPKKSAEEKKQESGYSWWFGWRRKSAPKAEPEEQQGIYLDDLTNDPEKMEKYLGTSLQDTRVDSGNGSIASPVPASPTELSPATLEEMPPSASSIENGLMKADVVEAQLLAGTTSSENAAEIEVSSTSSGERKQRHVSGASSASDSAVVSNDEGFNSDSVPYSRIRFIRSLRLPSDKLKKLGLKYGSNEARFSITTKFQGTSWCSCHIYLYKWNERLVISDIDGTITKSDVLGHVIPAIGGDWAHAGVAELYTRIKNNGYNLIYLSSRAIGQSHYTKKYLQSVAQDSKVLPDGPVLLSPDSVLVAFRREVIERKPYEFKIAALSDLKNLFPVKQPFSAGFGNRDTDVKSYTAVGIPDERILIINPQGNLKRADSIGYVSSYESMAMETVDYLFPPLVAQDADDHIVSNADRSQKRVHLKPLFTKPEKFSSFTHWHIKPRETLQLTATDFADYDAEQAANQKRCHSQVFEENTS